MSELLLVPTGHIMREYLDARGISQKELAIRTGISEKHISHVMNGSSRLTEEFALKVEKVMDEPPASYWLNYEAEYREQLARQEEIIRVNNWNLKALAKKFCFAEVFKGLNLSLNEQAMEMLKLLKISDFSNFDAAYADLAVDFMEDGGSKEAIAIWLNICEGEIELQNGELKMEYDKKALIEAIPKFKLLSNNNETERSLQSCRKLCNKLGIYFVMCEAVTNSKVRGALTTYKNHPAIYLSGRFQSHTHIWFALMHEMAHLILHYDKKETFVSLEEQGEQLNIREEEANEFARNVFAAQKDYAEFIKTKVYTEESIRKFAKREGTIPEFIVGRLQHDGEIKYNEFKYIKA